MIAKPHKKFNFKESIKFPYPLKVFCIVLARQGFYDLIYKIHGEVFILIQRPDRSVHVNNIKKGN